MELSELLDHCLAKPGAWPDNPWDHEVPVIKVGPPEQGKIFGRQGWNTMSLSGAIPDDELLEAIDESYRLVVSKLPKKHRPDGWDAT